MPFRHCPRNTSPLACDCPQCTNRREVNRQSQARWRERHGKPRHKPKGTFDSFKVVIPPPVKDDP